MFRRNLLNHLKWWKENPKRKPLILRGARQTGKTTLIEIFSGEFENFVSLNLEFSTDRRYWEGDPSVEQLLRNIEVGKDLKIVPGKTLLFLDEIQNEPRAIRMLRYFYEQQPNLHVVASGSLMEFSLKKKGFSFPVGRVEFCYLYPMSFEEYLFAVSNRELVAELNNVSLLRPTISSAIHTLAWEKFLEYLYIGGMPEAVKSFVEEKSYTPLMSIKESLLTSFEEDVPKYARPAQVPYLQFLIQQAPLFAGQRIQYANFANSGFRSREMKGAFETLEKALITQRVFGTPQVRLPLQPNFRVSPKLLYLDAGLVAHRLGVEIGSLQKGDLNDLFRGTLAEQIVGQELLAQEFQRREVPSFWYRDQPGSTAEVDYLLPIKGVLIPIEVKSGKSGKLRSLLQFMEKSPSSYAVRIYPAPLLKGEVACPSGKKAHLFSIPFYLTYRLNNLLAELF